MKRLSWSALLFTFFAITQNLLAANLPLTFHWNSANEAPVLRVETYEIKEGPHDELRIHFNPADAKVLQALTAQNLGKTLILKQGERILATPKIKAAITGQDFVVNHRK